MLKRVGQFIAENAMRLGAQLSTFEQNVATETADIRASFQPALTPRAFTSASLTGATLLPGQIAICDSSIGNVVVTLSRSPLLTPGWLAIVKKAAAFTVTVFPSGVTSSGTAGRINNATSKVYAAAGIGWIYFDGADWWA